MFLSKKSKRTTGKNLPRNLTTKLKCFTNPWPTPMTAIKPCSKPLLLGFCLVRPGVRPCGQSRLSSRRAVTHPETMSSKPDLICCQTLQRPKKCPFKPPSSGWRVNPFSTADASTSDGTSVIEGMGKMDRSENKVGLFHALRRSPHRQRRTVLPSMDRGFFKNGVSVNPFWRAKIAYERTRNRSGSRSDRCVDEFYFNIEYHPEPR